MNETMNIEHTVHIWKEESQFVAHAMSSDPTPEQARTALGA